ncbi:MAG: Gx transporter family protein [Candidatus Latescibacterota bacterium]|nr:Gx transporter family protein [Candidatus Latescibacterota bacterium]
MITANLRVLTRVGLLAATALILFLFESAAPRPLPWMRLGLGNTAVLVALLLAGAPAAMGVSLIKILVGGLLTGALAGPTFAISGGAGVASLLVMIVLHHLLSAQLSPVGISVAGAACHQLSQIAIASVYLGHSNLWTLAPLFLISGVASGVLTGMIAYFAVHRLRQISPAEPAR